MKNNTFIKRATILALSGAMAFTAFMAPTMATNVSANDGTGVYVTQKASKAAKRTLKNGKYYTVTGTKNYLPLRSACKYDDANEKIWLKNGDKVKKLADAKNGYVKVMAIDGAGDPIVGYVKAAYLK